MRPWYALLAALALCTGEAELAASPSFTIANDTFLRDSADADRLRIFSLREGPTRALARQAPACGLLGWRQPRMSHRTGMRLKRDPLTLAARTTWPRSQIWPGKRICSCSPARAVHLRRVGVWRISCLPAVDPPVTLKTFEKQYIAPSTAGPPNFCPASSRCSTQTEAT